jgi:hypothetical protein
MITRLSTRDVDGIAKTLAAGEAFTTHGALSGAPVRIGSAGRLGRLPDEHRSLWHQGIILAKSGRHTMYAVWSYQTPLCWRVDDGAWIFPEESYSVTTSRHQSRIRHAIYLAGGVVSS